MNPHQTFPQRIVFHLGAHKTATTYLQNWLNINCVSLRKLGFSIGLPDHLKDTSFEKFCFELSKPRERTVRTSEAGASLWEIWQSLGRCPRLIVSKENILGEAGRLYVNSDRVLKEIREIIPNKNITLIFYIRRNDHFIESHILQQFAHGSKISVDSVLSSIGTRTWLSVINSMEHYFPGSVKIEFFERIQKSELQFLYRFSELCNIDRYFIESSQIPSISQQNRSLSIEGLKIISDKWDSLNHYDRISLFNALQATHNTGFEAKPSLLSNSLRHEILLQNREANREIIEKYASGDDYLLKIYCEDDI